MSYFAVFGVPNRIRPLEADDIASNSGWAAFGDWAVRLGGHFPLLARLGEEGQVYSEDGSGNALAALEKELRQALSDQPLEPDANVLGVLKRLLGVLSQRPARAFWFAVTDGTEG